jgi:hypothetical protein
MYLLYSIRLVLVARGTDLVVRSRDMMKTSPIFVNAS